MLAKDTNHAWCPDNLVLGHTNTAPATTVALGGEAAVAVKAARGAERAVGWATAVLWPVPKVAAMSPWTWLMVFASKLVALVTTDAVCWSSLQWQAH